MKHRVFFFSVLAASLSSVYAATEKDLERQPFGLISNVPLKEIKKEIDSNHTTHIRLQQTYEGLRVWGGDVVVHVPKGESTALLTSKCATVNGLIYENLAKDLQTQGLKIPNINREEMVMETAVRTFAAPSSTEISQKKSELMIYPDENKKAHYAYLVSFFAKPVTGTPAIPTFIIDAETFKIYEQWDNLQTANGGGFGGNPKMGQLIYDGLQGHLPILNIDRFESWCALFNVNVNVVDVRKNDVPMQFGCKMPDPTHNYVFWDGNFDEANGGYSPGNDALYAGQVIKEMYQGWYGIPVLTDANGNPMQLLMRVHADMENAYWDGSSMTFGDGYETFYPLVSLGVASHEISHGFTEQHSNLVYRYQSGGLNEAFSDMAAQAAEFYSNGTSSWMIGAEITKGDWALRYMDQPSKDCNGDKPGHNCSIDNLRQYRPWMDVHYTSGIFNKAFYLIATTPGWDTKKAFDVMVAANRFYWIPNTTFRKAACGVLQATADSGYPVNEVRSAFKGVGIPTSDC